MSTAANLRVINTFDRLPPHDLEAEEACIAACMVEPRALPDVMQLSPADMFRSQHGAVLTAIRSLYERGEGVNQITVAHELAQHEQLESVGGSAFLADLIRRLPTAIGVEFYVAIVQRMALARRIVAAGSAMMALGYQAHYEDALGRCFDLLAEVEAPGQQHGSRTAAEVLAEGLRERIEAEMENPRALRGDSWGIRVLDMQTGGLIPGCVYLYSADTSMGKSLLGGDVMRRVAGNGVRVVVFSTEMSAEQMAQRMAAQIAGVDPQVARTRSYYTPDEKARMRGAMDTLERLPIHFAEHVEPSVGGIRAEVRRIEARYGPVGGLLWDHLQHSSGGGETSIAYQLDAISHALKNVARWDGKWVLVVNHLSRATEFNKRSRISRMRHSAGPGQNADYVWIMEPVREDPVTGWADLGEDGAHDFMTAHGYVDLRLAFSKTRFGRTGAVYLRMDWRQGGRFFEVGS